MKIVDFPLVGFAGNTTYPLEAVNLQVVLGGGWKIIKINVTFILVDAPSIYNDILVRTINTLKIVASTSIKR